MDFRSLLYQLESAGFYEFVLPFILVFTILFAVLQKVQIFGARKKNFNIVLSVIFSLTIFLSTDLILILNNYISRMSFFIVFGLLVMIMFAFFGQKDSKLKKGKGVWLGSLLAIIGVFWSFGENTGFGSFGAFNLMNYLDSTTMAFILGVAAII